MRIARRVRLVGGMGLGTLACAVSFISPALAEAPRGVNRVQLESAADHQVSAQGTYRGGLASSWEFRLGSGQSAKTITGISAHGLLAAASITKQQAHQDSALQAAQSILAAYDRGFRKRRPVTQDIEFLAAAGYVIDAGRWFGVIVRGQSAAAYVQHVIAARKASGNGEIAGWDIASAIRAAVVVGQVDYGRQLLQELVARRAQWDLPKAAGQPLARGSLLFAMATLKAHAGLGADESRAAAELARELVAAQHASGGWLDGTGARICTQTTAYAILGLAQWEPGSAAAARGRRFLTHAAVTDTWYLPGGHVWATTYSLRGVPGKDFNGMIQSEVARSLAGI